jgi:large subunit ribosomal protein L3
MKFILGKKIGMTQVFLANGEVVPVTRVVAGPCQVVQVRKTTKQSKEMTAVQLGFGTKKEWRLKKPQAGHLKGLEPVQELHEFATSDTTEINRGDSVKADTFSTGDIVNIIGTSKGKGFQGVVKRHHFRGAPASHGHKHDLRMPGSIGAGGVQRVFKGMRMAGRMGGDRVTVKNLEIIEVHPETNEIYIKGAVPGGRNAVLMIIGEGELKISKKDEVKTQSVAEEVKVEETVAEPVVEEKKEEVTAAPEAPVETPAAEPAPEEKKAE